jgi:hypothetical protein
MRFLHAGGSAKVLAAVGLVAGAAGITAVSIGSNGSKTKSCREGGWPRTAAEPARRYSSQITPAYFVWHDGAGWHLRLSASGASALTGKVSANRHISVLAASRTAKSALERHSRGFSFRVGGTKEPQAIQFKASCATRLSFSFKDARVFLGSQGTAPSPSFELRRPAVTGVSGHVIVGPTCPIVSPQCPPSAPARGFVRIETAPETRGSRGRFVKRVATDRNGAFSTDLDPGGYILAPEQSGTGYPIARASQVRVDAGVVNRVTLSLDTGIR